MPGEPTKTDKAFSKARSFENPGRQYHKTDPSDRGTGHWKDGFVHPNSMLGRADRAGVARETGGERAANRIMNPVLLGSRPDHDRDIQLHRDDSRSAIQTRKVLGARAVAGRR